MCHLQELSSKYRDAGLVVLGFNHADTREIAIDLLAQDSVDFLNILDSSPQAVQAISKYETLIGMSAVPLTYVIDREGKVVDAWYGYQAEKARQVLRRLKLDGN